MLLMKEICTLIGLIAFANAYYLDFPEPRIVGGEEATPYEFNWQVSLERRSWLGWSHSCGGSIIASDFVLTAAHCVDGTSASNLRIVAGLHDRTNKEGATTHSVSSIIMHPDYSSSAAGYPNDIALLKLSTAITVAQAGTVPLAEETDNFVDNTDCVITGWGRTSGGGPLSNVLLKAKMDVIPNTNCTEKWKGISGATIHDTHICVEGDEKESACNGDSGGPLVCRDGNKGYVLAGATSWGISTCSGEYPSVYVRVQKYRSWISGHANI